MLVNPGHRIRVGGWMCWSNWSVTIDLSISVSDGTMASCFCRVIRSTVAVTEPRMELNVGQQMMMMMSSR